MQLNHPNAVLRRWQSAREAPKGPGSKSGKPGYKDIVRDLQEQLDAANKKLRNRDDLSEGRDWTWHDTPEQIAAAMLRLYPDKAKRLGSALQNAAKSTTRKQRVYRKLDQLGKVDLAPKSSSAIDDRAKSGARRNRGNTR